MRQHCFNLQLHNFSESVRIVHTFLFSTVAPSVVFYCYSPPSSRFNVLCLLPWRSASSFWTDLCKRQRWLCVKIPIDQQFLKRSDQTVWQHSCHIQSRLYLLSLPFWCFVFTLARHLNASSSSHVINWLAICVNNWPVPNKVAGECKCTLCFVKTFRFLLNTFFFAHHTFDVTFVQLNCRALGFLFNGTKEIIWKPEMIYWLRLTTKRVKNHLKWGCNWLSLLFSSNFFKTFFIYTQCFYRYSFWFYLDLLTCNTSHCRSYTFHCVLMHCLWSVSLLGTCLSNLWNT